MRNRKRLGILLAIGTVLIASSLYAAEGGMTDNMIEYFRKNVDLSGHNRAMFNALTNTDIEKIAVNREIIQNHNDVFSHKIKARGITNQKSSGRCWLFSSLNVFRPSIIEKYKMSNFEFSQNYLAFWDKMEKANTFLEYIIEFRDRDLLDRELVRVLEMPLNDGGYWHYTSALIKKYGLVPAEIMPESNSSGKTRAMNSIIGRKLRSDAAELRRMYADGVSVADLRQGKETMLSEVYKMLVFNLGEPPVKFTHIFEDRDTVVNEPKEYTPLSFYKEFTAIDLDEYVDIYNDPSREYYQHYAINMTRNMYDQDDIHYVNAPIEVIKKAAMESILNDDPVLFGCDVGKDQSRELGIMADHLYDFESIYDVDMSMTKAERSLFRESTVNHAMVFVGIDIRDGKPTKWRVENSWGNEKGNKGYWTLYDEWFDKHVYDIVIKKKYVPEDILALYKQNPILLPAWDPMWDYVMNISF